MAGTAAAVPNAMGLGRLLLFGLEAANNRSEEKKRKKKSISLHQKKIKSVTCTAFERIWTYLLWSRVSRSWNLS
jgi:hypothetical protein